MSPEAIWALLTDFARWPDWNPEVKSVTVEPGEVAAGLTFRWRTGSGTITSTIREAEAPRRVVWSRTTFGIQLSTSGGSSHVKRGLFSTSRSPSPARSPGWRDRC